MKELAKEYKTPLEVDKPTFDPTKDTEEGFTFGRKEPKVPTEPKKPIDSMD